MEVKGLGHHFLSFNCSWLLCSILWKNLTGEQPSSCKRLCIKASEKTIFMQTNNFNHQKTGISFLFVLCKKSVNTYRQSHTELFLIFKIILTPKSPKPMCVLGRGCCSLSIEQLTSYNPLGDPSHLATHFLLETVILVFQSWAIPVQWEAQWASLCTSESSVVAILASWEVRWLNSASRC